MIEKDGVFYYMHCDLTKDHLLATTNADIRKVAIMENWLVMTKDHDKEKEWHVCPTCEKQYNGDRQAINMVLESIYNCP